MKNMLSHLRPHGHGKPRKLWTTETEMDSPVDFTCSGSREAVEPDFFQDLLR